MTRFTVRSRGLSETVEAETAQEAARIAVSIAAAVAPVELGILISVTPEGGEETYVPAAKIVQQLGLEVTT